jgi:(heptosyl)LPS beta-1,4-glucosyltransferase
MRISATIITLNEEINIGRCIDSLEGVVDEIIVMDSNSTDKTKEICLQKGVRFVSQDWLGYAAQKNRLNSLAQYEMILSIDADEALTESLKESILALKKKQFIGVYSINRITNYCGKWIKHSGWYPDVKVRLFPKETSHWEGDIVHEELIFDPIHTPYLLRGDLAHYSYVSHKQHRARADHYSRLTAKKYVEKNKKVFLFQPAISAVFRFFKMFVLKLGFLDGVSGFHIASISAASNFYKYQVVKKIYREAK